MKLTAELGHETPVMALRHAIEMRTALRVIHTWSAFPPIDPGWTTELIDKTLKVKK